MGEAEVYVCDGIASAEFVLEDAVAIAVVAFLVGEMSDGAGLEVHGIYEEDEVLGLAAVSPYVLHGSGSHLAGDGGEVLEAVPVAVNGVLHPVVPDDACADAHIDIVTFVGRDGDVPHGGMQDGAGVVAEEEQVTASADVEERSGVAVGGATAYEHLQFVNAVVLHEVGGLCVDAEGVMPA